MSTPQAVNWWRERDLARVLQIIRDEAATNRDKGGEVPKLPETDKAFYNGHWQATHNLEHDIKDYYEKSLTGAAEPSMPTPSLAMTHEQNTSEVDRLVNIIGGTYP